MTNPTGRWAGIDHVQLAIPVGAEDVARAFYVDVFGLVEVALVRQDLTDVQRRRGCANDVTHLVTKLAAALEVGECVVPL